MNSPLNSSVLNPVTAPSGCDPWSAEVLTLFPEMFPGPLGHSLAGKALEKGLWRLNTTHLRDFASPNAYGVDDACYGGGAGMVMRPDIIDAALTQTVRNKTVRDKTATKGAFSCPLIYLTPRGAPLTQGMVRRYALQSSGVVLLCGRYEGIDQRVIEQWQMEEVSIGDYILSGGEIAALTLIDACIRLLPGVMGKEESALNESFELGLLEYPQYTRPRVWNNRIVPEILLSGDHQKIASWRQAQAENITKARRPDLWAQYLEQTGKK